MPRVAVLWPSLPPYLDACLTTLGEVADVLLIAPGDSTADRELPFRFRHIGALDADARTRVASELSDFAPDVVLVCGWHIPSYRRGARDGAPSAVKLLYTDNPWIGSVRQQGGRFVSSIYLKPFYDAAFVPGERQRKLVRAFGFDDD